MSKYTLKLRKVMHGMFANFIFLTILPKKWSSFKSKSTLFIVLLVSYQVLKLNLESKIFFRMTITFDDWVTQTLDMMKV